MNYIKETVEVIKNLDNLRKSEENLKYQIKEVREDLKGYKEINNSCMPGGGAGAPDDRICNLIFKEKQLLDNLSKTKRALNKLDKIMNALTEDDKTFIIDIYTSEKTDTEIARDKGICRRTLNYKKKELTKKIAVQLWGIVTI